MKIKNVSKATRGIPTSPFQEVAPGQEITVSDADLESLMKNGRFKMLLDIGTLKLLPGGDPVPDDPAPDEPEPEAHDDGVHIVHEGSGWYSVHVNGMRVTDKNVRQDRAEEIARDYQ